MTDYVELYIDQGADFNILVNINDDITNLAQNISGYVVTSSLRRSLLSPNTSSSLQCQITHPQDGEIELSMTAANTANLRPGTYLFDVKVNDTASTKISRLIEGIIIVTPGITK